MSLRQKKYYFSFNINCWVRRFSWMQDMRKHVKVLSLCMFEGKAQRLSFTSLCYQLNKTRLLWSVSTMKPRSWRRRTSTCRSEGPALCRGAGQVLLAWQPHLNACTYAATTEPRTRQTGCLYGPCKHLQKRKNFVTVFFFKEGLKLT